MSRPTPLPWTISQLGSTDLWIEGPEGSAATEEFPKDRRVVCTFPTSGERTDMELALANAEFIVRVCNEVDEAGGGR